MKTEIRPLVSVIIPVYNQERYLSETIESVLNQTYSSFELILINDGSVDSSSEIMETYAAKDSRVITIHIENGGKPNAVNTAASVAKGELLAFMDHDDLMVPERLEKQVNYLEAHPEISAVSSNSYYVNEDGIIMGVQRYGKLETPEKSREYMERKQRIMCSFTSLTVKKSVFEKVGGLRSRYWPSDDIDFINRLPQNGFLLIILNENLVKYRIHSQSTTSTNQWQLFRMATYTNYCVDQRNLNLEEPTFEQFETMRKQEPWLARVKRNAHNHSIVFLQKANFHFTLKKQTKFATYFTLAFFLDPSYVMSNIRKRLNSRNT